MKYPTNRKKIRGWKKQIKKIDAWYEKNKVPNITVIESYQHEYTKVWIDPWFRLTKRNPPVWYFRLILDSFERLYTNWEFELDKTEFSYDLQLWIFEKNYVQSELVCIRTENKGDTIKDFFTDCPELREFPIAKFKTEHFKPELFDWTLKYDTLNYYKSMDELTEKDIDKLLKNGYQRIEESGEQRFWKPCDYVWIGRKK